MRDSTLPPKESRFEDDQDDHLTHHWTSEQELIQSCRGAGPMRSDCGVPTNDPEGRQGAPCVGGMKSWSGPDAPAFS